MADTSAVATSAAAVRPTGGELAIAADRITPAVASTTETRTMTIVSASVISSSVPSSGSRRVKPRAIAPCTVTDGPMARLLGDLRRETDDHHDQQQALADQCPRPAKLRSERIEGDLGQDDERQGHRGEQPSVAAEDRPRFVPRRRNR